MCILACFYIFGAWLIFFNSILPMLFNFVVVVYCSYFLYTFLSLFLLPFSSLFSLLVFVQCFFLCVLVVVFVSAHVSLVVLCSGYCPLLLFLC